MISDNIKAFYDRHQSQSTHPTLDEFIQALEAEIEMYTKVYIIVDALDECPEVNGTRVKLLKALRSLAGSVNLMVTSRDLTSIEQQLLDAPRLRIRADDGDMTKYIESQLDYHPHLAKIRANITKKILTKARGM